MSLPPSVLQSMLKALGVTPEAIETMAKSIAGPIKHEMSTIRAQLNRIEQKLDMLLDQQPNDAVILRKIQEGFENVRNS